MVGSRIELELAHALETGIWCRGASSSQSVLVDLVGPPWLAGRLALRS